MPAQSQCRILVVEDEPLPLANISRYLKEEGYEVCEAVDGLGALQQINNRDLDLILLDLKLAGTNGITILQHARKVSPQTLVIVMTAHASIDSCIEALRLGAQDYILKPLLLDDLLNRVSRLMEHRRAAWEVQRLRRQVNSEHEANQMIGGSHAIRQIRELIGKVAPTPSTVLISGESGAGKEVVARAIHRESQRSNNVFLAVNCSAIPATLLESQLFGHVKGAFTGAVSFQDGLFKQANGGTIFLDEIGEMPLPLQPKILRVIEERAVTPVGGGKLVPVDVRIVAATNRTLWEEVKAGHFREDLYYRLNVIAIEVPPLRQRLEDVPLIVERFIERKNFEMKRSYKGVDGTALRRLMSMPWPGNVRELNNVIERAMILGDGEWIRAGDLPPPQATIEEPSLPEGAHNLENALRVYERSHIENVLKETSGDRTQAAKLIGMSRSSLYRKMAELKMDLGPNETGDVAGGEVRSRGLK